MTSSERARSFLAKAEAIAAEARAEFERGLWDLCIRRCQEAVELALKGLLASRGVEYPKVHDVGPVLKKLFHGKGAEAPPRGLAEVLRISRDLAMQRAPAFYGEEEFDAAQARDALKGCRKTLSLVRRALS